MNQHVVKTEPHTRIYHFNDGATLLLTRVTQVVVEDNCMAVTHDGGKRTIVYRTNLDYCQERD